MTGTTDKRPRRVYSTAAGRICPRCGKPVAECVCRRKEAVSPGDGIVRVSRETKGRKGKGVTLIKGVPPDRSELQVLAKAIKTRCGSGGTVKNGIIEIQGDHRETVAAVLEERGYRVRRSGG